MQVPDIIIAVDGYSSTGKSTLAKLIAKEFGFLYLDSGAMYRGVTVFAQENGLIDENSVISPDLEKALEGLVDPKKTMLFNPAESIDFNGNTGPFVQYTHARICSVLRKAAEQGIQLQDEVKVNDLQPKEKEILVMMYGWPMVLNQAAEGRSPAMIANFIFDLAKEFNQFYQECSILREENEDRRMFRLQVCDMVAALLRNASELLGIGMPNRM